MEKFTRTIPFFRVPWFWKKFLFRRDCCLCFFDEMDTWRDAWGVSWQYVLEVGVGVATSHWTEVEV